MNSPIIRSRMILTVVFSHILFFSLFPISLLWGHVGHKAILTRGVSVEGKVVTLSEDVQEGIGLTTAEVDFREMPEIVRATATVWVPPHQRAFSSSRIGGKAIEIRVRPGDIVKRGQVLAVIQSLEFENLQYELMQENQGLELLQKNRNRVKRLVDLGILPGKQLIEINLEYQDQKNSYNGMRRKLKTLGLEDNGLDRIIEKRAPIKAFQILAPASGTIIHADITRGKMVEPTEHLFEMHDMTTVWMQGHIRESDFYKAKTGQEVQVGFAAYPNRVFKGNIDLIDFAVDPDQKIIRIWAKIKNSDFLLKPGMFGQMEVIVRKNGEAVAVPRAAVLSNGEDQFVFIENDEGVYELKNIALGISNDNFVEVLDAVLPGDKVVVAGHHQLAALFVRGALSLSEEARGNMGLVVETAGERSIQDVLKVNALVEIPTSGQSVVSARIPGKIVSFFVRLGDSVDKGAPIARLRSLELENIQLEYIQAQLKLDLVRTSLERIQNLTKQRKHRQHILPLKELGRVETEFRQKQVALWNLERQLLVMGLSKDTLTKVIRTRTPVPYLTIRAPSSGKIVDMDVALGQVVEPANQLMKIVNFSKIWVRGHVYEAQIERLGTVDRDVRIRFEGLPNKTIAGKLAFTTHRINSESRVLPVWSELRNTNGILVPGMRAEMSIIVGQRNKSVAVPLTAILKQGRRSFAFVFEDSGTDTNREDIIKRVSVSVGAQDDRYIQILSGLKAGDRIAVRGVDMLNTAYMTVQ